MGNDLWRELSDLEKKRAAERLEMSYTERANHTNNQLSKNILKLMDEKESNLIVAADNLDFETPTEVLDFAKEISSEIIGFKFHPRVFEKELGWLSKGYDKELFDLSSDNGFIVINDTKIDDIGNIAIRQAMTEMGNAHMVTVLTAAGGKTLEAINDAGKSLFSKDGIPRGSMPLLYMTPEGHLFDYIFDSVIDHANEYGAVASVVAGKSVDALYHAAARLKTGILIFSPGVKIDKIKGDRGQTYGHPYNAVKNGTDANIVGGGIYKAKDPLEAARKYRKQGFDGYIARAGNAFLDNK